MVDLHALYATGETRLNDNISLAQAEVVCQDLDQSLICGAINGTLLEEHSERPIVIGFNQWPFFGTWLDLDRVAHKSNLD